jgi:hypothetical protein
LSKRKVACFVVFGAAAVTLAAYSSYAQRINRASVAAQATGDFLQPQITNRAAKASRIEIASQAVAHKPVFALASMGPDIGLERPADPVIASALQIPDAVPAPAAVVAPKPAAVAALPPEKPKHLLPPPPPPPAPAPSAHSGLLDDNQISGLKGRLRLSSDQAEYWPAVEAALRDVVRTQLRGTKHAVAGKINIDTDSPEVQKLMRLREDQKNEVRKLARVIGLDQVASQI